MDGYTTYYVDKSLERLTEAMWSLYMAMDRERCSKREYSSLDDLGGRIEDLIRDITELKNPN